MKPSVTTLGSIPSCTHTQKHTKKQKTEGRRRGIKHIKHVSISQDFPLDGIRRGEGTERESLSH